jgi:excisionase family DNA binding protein
MKKTAFGDQPEQIKPGELVSIRDAAVAFNVHPNTLRNCIRDGRLPAVRLGARIIRIRTSDLESLFTTYQNGEYGVWRGRVGAN